MKKLLTPFRKVSLQLKSHVVMAPVAGNRVIGNLPNKMMANAGLIITEVFHIKIRKYLKIGSSIVMKVLQNNQEYLITIGRSFLTNPDFANRIKKYVSLNGVDLNTLSTEPEQVYINSTLNK
ncbi:hypothetical protein [Chryseobacterium sp. Bi04]|uniref:hypothetical protein n=1 Tax=Chryseobacterium sp. Bi04 TaxID=2822345 RepID=UPI001DA9CC57|nr:hypothetical protein [Chryseobacterium sp. Bi04]CAH0255433.1 hypothetical protein SRABI04_03341 [Chryseobacterium sp. Bi04]